MNVWYFEEALSEYDLLFVIYVYSAVFQFDVECSEVFEFDVVYS